MPVNPGFDSTFPGRENLNLRTSLDVIRRDAKHDHQSDKERG